MPEKPTVVILGASADRAKFGNKSVRAHALAGYKVYPVNPKGGVIEGLTCLSSLDQAPGPVDRISVYLPPALGLSELDRMAALRPKEVWLNPGAESSELIQAGRAKGLTMIAACSIVALGLSPSQFN